MFKGKASPIQTRQFLEMSSVHPGQIREFCGVPVSALGLGTYLGNSDDVTDVKVALACVQALSYGCNIFDSAINYRGQRAERSIGEMLRRAILSGKAKREEVFISTKGGFVPSEIGSSDSISSLFEKEYVARGIVEKKSLVAECHCIEPAFLNSQIEKSRKNLQIETIDLYYVHNPETQLEEFPERLFYEKLGSAFEMLERAVKEGRIGAYGMATWNGFRDEPTAQTSLQLEKCIAAAEKAARNVGTEKHSFKAVQMPLNLGMPEAAMLSTQKIAGKLFSALDAAEALGIDVAVSVPLLQARLCHNLPEFVLEAFPQSLSQAHCALAFSTGIPVVKSAMVGMKAAEHVEHNLAFLKHAPLTSKQLELVQKAIVE